MSHHVWTVYNRNAPVASGESPNEREFLRATLRLPCDRVEFHCYPKSEPSFRGTYTRVSTPRGTAWRCIG